MSILITREYVGSIFLNGGPTSKVRLFDNFFHYSCAWRHQNKIKKTKSNFLRKMKRVCHCLTHIHQYNAQTNVMYVIISSNHYQIVRKLPKNLNHLSNFFSEVWQIIFLASLDVLFIISGSRDRTITKIFL